MEIPWWFWSLQVPARRVIITLFMKNTWGAGPSKCLPDEWWKKGRPNGGKEAKIQMRGQLLGHSHHSDITTGQNT